MDEMFGFRLQRDKLYKQVADKVQELIAAESLRPGDKLPGERELADRMGVSRTVVREAIRVLSVRGLVRVKSGCGTYVQELSHKDAAASIELYLKLRQDACSLQDVHEVRRMIEVETAGLAAQRATESDLAAMEAALRDMSAHRHDPAKYAFYDLAFHTAVAAATHNDLFGVLLGPISDLLMQIVRVSVDAPRAMDVGLAHHRRILEKIRERDKEEARQAMSDHLDQARRQVETVRKQTDSP
ncbi:MAG: FadR family transcriptional regulator [Anaerolineae bacterium]|nr:FadR family transcriptional regulator [Anaerolineae bacterium]